MALALLICLATLLWCILLTRRQRKGLDKTLTGLLGLFAIYESLHILRDSGFAMFAHLRAIEGWVDLVSACLYLTAAAIMKTSSIDHATAKVHVRLMEANERQVDLASGGIAAIQDLSHSLVDSCPLAIFALDSHGIVSYWNAAAEGMIGWKRNEMFGHPLPFELKSPIPCKDGSFIEAALWTSPIHSPQGPPRGTLIIVAGSAALHDAGLELSAAAQPALGDSHLIAQQFS